MSKKTRENSRVPANAQRHHAGKLLACTLTAVFGVSQCPDIVIQITRVTTTDCGTTLTTKPPGHVSLLCGRTE